MKIHERFFAGLREWRTLKQLIGRNIKLKYKGTLLGILWIFLQPLCMIAILSFVFTRIMPMHIPFFPLFLCAGVLPWTFFSNALVDATSALRNNSHVALKIHFPLELIPLSYCFSALFDFCIAMGLYIVLIHIFWSVIPYGQYPILLYVVLCQIGFVSGLGLFLSAAYVFFKDVGHMLTVVLSFWFYVTPVFYALEQIPQEFLPWFYGNPMLHFVTAYRALLFYGMPLSPHALTILGLLGVGSLSVGLLLFIAVERRMVKEL